MLKQIGEARYIGIRDQDGVRCAEVQVKVKDDGNATYTVCITKQGGHYHLASVVKEEADRALDWFDNDLHHATANVTAAWFSQADVEANWTEREAFLQDLLDHEQAGPRIREALG